MKIEERIALITTADVDICMLINWGSSKQSVRHLTLYGRKQTHRHVFMPPSQEREKPHKHNVYAAFLRLPLK